MAVLVTGGAGYIGSVFVEMASAQGRPVVVLDNLDRGHRAAVGPDVPFYEGSVGDRELVRKIVRDHGIDACVHYAALAYVGESVEDPSKYYGNNVGEGVALLNALLEAGVRRFVFSSTCATYGEPQQVPIPESHPQSPANPYGWSKFMMERVLESYDHAYGLKYAALRYFNAAGATDEHGEDHTPESHLIPCVLNVAAGKASHVTVFGEDYPTPDGTAIRDYIHVTDLNAAHLLALGHLRGKGESLRLNLGTGKGQSVKEVIDVVAKVTGKPIPVKAGPRRAGDTTALVAQADKARSVLGWQAKGVELEPIVESAWRWRQAHPDGYADSSAQRK